MGTCKSIVVGAVTVAAVVFAASAEAGVSWSIDVATPLVGAVVGNAPGYGRAGYYARPMVARPGYGVPQFVGGPRGVYAPVPYAPVPVVAPQYAPVFAPQYVPVYSPSHGGGYPVRRWHRHELRPVPWVVGAPAYAVRPW